MPKIKLKLPKKPTDTQPQPDPTAPTPVTKPKAPRKPRVKKEKPTRTSNPTPKKRALEASTISDDENEHFAGSSPPPLKKTKTIKFNFKNAPNPPLTPAPLTGVRQIKFTGIKGKKLSATRPKGVGYDSEAEDNESDPAIEEDFILRMLPGEHCDYIREAVAEQRFGPKSQGGADIRLRFLRTDGRRAVLSVLGTLYAATLVDLPCIIEGMKSWDRKAWHKSVDISQMLLILGPIKNEEEANNYPLPKRDIDEKTMQYAHGLTPPMRWVRKRRFRKRVNRAAIEDVEKEVERLLAEDAKARSSRWTFVDVRQLEIERAQRLEREMQAEMEGYDEEDAEGEDDDQQYYGETVDTQVAEEPEDDFELHLQQAFEEEEAEQETSATTPAQLTSTNAPSPGSFALDTPIAAESPAATLSKAATSGDEDESSDEDADSIDDVDEDAVEQQQDLMRQREAIEDLQAAIKSQEAELERVQNNILKKKLVAKIQSLKAELESKMAAMGEGAEE